MRTKTKNWLYRLKSPLILAILVIFVSSLVLYLYRPKVHAQIFITSGTTWTVPSDWSNSNNIIEVIGGGGGGGGGANSGGSDGGGGGGGGGYASITNATLSPGSTVSIQIGSGGGVGAVAGNGGDGSDTYLCNSVNSCSSITDSGVIVGAKGGAGGGGSINGTPGTSGTGGPSTSAIGTTAYNGGDGGPGASSTGNNGGGGGGGGGAAGKNATGNSGTVGDPSGPAGPGGQGDGTFGGGGGNSSGSTGGSGTEYDSSHGSGGGGAGGDGVTRSGAGTGGNGGQYGGGGGGGGGSKHNTGAAGAAGNQGMIRISYNYTAQDDYRWRLDDGNETTGTTLAAQDAPATITYGTPVRLRISLANLGDNTTFSYRLEYAPYVIGCGSWTAVPVSATTEHFNMYNSSYYTDQTASNNISSGPGVLSDPAGYSFTSGKLVKPPSNTATSQTLGSKQFTELEYAIQANSHATYSKYCFRVTTSAGTPLDNYFNYPILSINYPPSAPTIYSVANGTTNVPLTPVFQLRSSDNNNDYLKYIVEVCPSNSWPCGSGGITYDQTSSQTCWESQDAQSGTAYNANYSPALSSVATCRVPAITADILAPSTTYYMRAKAIDPGGSNTFSPYSSVVSFSTGSLRVNILGGTSLTGGADIGN